jgi:hypothetical protein
VVVQTGGAVLSRRRRAPLVAGRAPSLTKVTAIAPVAPKPARQLGVTVPPIAESEAKVAARK